ncbi:hypothetical protein CkaCkLH20_12538 [Colletotrichum karsti]|uniref:Uncharacterized protein n=1 Tax=Colletotrichum karsti TaxID=1095194 RepID=A0A9P6HTJ2_9PEZI|nr:uncharacterized protein CkaCkLH20_12538 [Colletotrichum karsti]KAF9869929.1 hypothetical protein CkaCkLH20_12538 [Colletotrichum karsti]
MSSTTVAVSSAASPSVRDHMHNGGIAAYLRGCIVLYSEGAGVFHVHTNAKKYGQQSVFYLRGSPNDITDNDISRMLAETGLGIREIIFDADGAYIILHGVRQAAEVRQAFSIHGDVNTEEVPILDLSELHGVQSDPTSTLVLLSWTRPTRNFFITALDDSSADTVRSMADTLEAGGFPRSSRVLGPAATHKIVTGHLGQKILQISDATGTASEGELSRVLFGTNNYDKTRFALGTGRSWSDDIDDQVDYVNNMLNHFGDLEMPVTSIRPMVNSTHVGAAATFATSEAAAKATAKLMGKRLPFANDSRLEIQQVHEYDINFPNESSWRRASDFCSSDECLEFMKTENCGICDQGNTDNLQIAWQCPNRRAAVHMRRMLSRFAQPTTPEKPTRNGSTDTRTCIICYEDECDSDSTVTGACGHSYCLDCFTNFIGAGAWTKDKGMCCVGTDGKGTICGSTLTFDIIADQVPRGLVAEILTKSLDAQVAKNPDWLQRCSDPDCSHVYEPAPKGTYTADRLCGDCGVLLCRVCGEGHPQSDYCPDSGNEELQQALDELDARGCPNCKVPIEKNEGCNHMTCPFCDVHICWWCMATFRNGPSVYQHMTAKHGRIGEGEEYMAVAADGAPIADEQMLAEQRQVEAMARGAGRNDADDEGL